MNILVKNIDFNKYHTFFLEYYKSSNDYNHSYTYHLVRPSTVTYDEIVDDSRTRTYTLEGAIATFDKDETVPQILLECMAIGVSIDFIDVKVRVEDGSSNRWDNYEKTIQVIDTHKDDVEKLFDVIDAPLHYVALNRRKADALKFLVINRAEQRPDVDFMHGKYDNKAVVAGFRSHAMAYELCRKLNCE